MATKRRRGDSWQYVIKNAKLLPGPVYRTYRDEAEGDAEVARIEGWLKRGIVPPGLVEDTPKTGHATTLAEAIRSYYEDAQVKLNDKDLLDVLRVRIGGTKLADIDYPWVLEWIKSMKSDRPSPITIRHYVGAMRRMLDHIVDTAPMVMPTNPIRRLKAGYSAYPEDDEDAPDEEPRDRRLEDGEEEAIRRILDGAKPENRQRPMELKYQAALELLFDLALETGMRMKEIYTLENRDVKIDKKTIYLRKTKNKRPRQVPMTSVAIKVVETYKKHVADGTRGMSGWKHAHGRLLPFWDGDLSRKATRRVTSRLSRQYIRIFEAAGAHGLHFHDLRHEATCRFYERTTLNDVEISRITGHLDPRMLRRYASLRGSDLAGKLW